MRHRLLQNHTFCKKQSRIKVPQSICFPLEMTIPTALVLGLAVNAMAEAFLTIDLRRPVTQLVGWPRHLRLARWLLIFIVFGATGAAELSLMQCIPLTLFAVSASTDLECKTLPPDWFTLLALLAGLFAAYGVVGVAGLRAALLAQAVCFALWALGIAFFNLCAAGDIKLAAQFGAACGSVWQAMWAGWVAWLVVCAVVLIAFVWRVAAVGPRKALRSALTLYPPQAPLLFCGLLAVTIWGTAW
jgi:hypothetical protein